MLRAPATAGQGIVEYGLILFLTVAITALILGLLGFSGGAYAICANSSCARVRERAQVQVQAQADQESAGQ